MTMLISKVPSFSKFLNASYNILLTPLCWPLQIHSPPFSITLREAFCIDCFAWLPELSGFWFLSLVETEVRIYVPWAPSPRAMGSECAPLHKVITLSRGSLLQGQPRLAPGSGNGFLPSLVHGAVMPRMFTTPWVWHHSVLVPVILPTYL